MTYNAAVNVHDDLLNLAVRRIDDWHGSGGISYKVDSRLLIIIGMPEERVEDRGISYYVWEEDHLKMVRFVKKTWER